MENRKESESYGIIMANIEEENEENYFFFIIFIFLTPSFHFLRKQSCIIRSDRNAIQE